MEEHTLHIEEFPSKILHRHIECFKIYTFKSDVPVQLFPKGIFELVFQSNNQFLHQTAYNTDWEKRPQNFIGGLHGASYFVKPSGRENVCIAVEFKPHSAKYFLPHRMDLYKNTLLDIHEVWGRSAGVLTDQLDSIKSVQQKIEIIEHFLADKLSNQHTSVIDKAVNHIIQSSGFLKVSDLATSVQLSASQFRKRFTEEIGLSPRQYLKIIRINTTLSIFEKGYEGPLTELTYNLGYFDQSHFIRDFKSIAGSSPKNYQRNKINA